MEAKTLHCQSCGAAVGADDLQCPYCRSPLASVACPHCLAMVSRLASHCPACGTALQQVAETASDLNCPDCRKPLAETVVGGVDLHQCHGCGGVWVAQKVFEQFAADREKRGEVIALFPVASHAVRVEAVKYRPCPQCAKLMNRQNYARISGVVLDLCKDHGLWFDRDELSQVLQFIEGGGLDRSRARQAQDLETQRRLTAAPRPSELPMGAWGEAPPAAQGLPGFLELLEAIFRR